MAEPGAKVVAVSDVRGGIFAEPGLDIPSTCEHASETGSVVGMKGAPDIDNAELLMLDVELLIQAALGGAITGANADKVSAQLVVEAANSPVTPEAGEILRGRSITVIPDILATDGGVTVSYFERVQNLQQFCCDQKLVNRELERKMVDAWRRVNDRRR